MLLMQISDPHFGTERRNVADALLRLARRERPDLVVASGDITQRATKAQFAAARRYFDELQAPALMVLPGNHDIPLFDLAARVFSPLGRYRAAFGSDLEPVVDTPAWLVLGLNTTRRWRHRNGEVSDAQIDRAAQRLAAAGPNQLRVVVVHQPIAVARPQDERHLLRGGRRAIREWSQAGADLILGGHIHLPYVLPLHEIDPSLPRRLWAVQAGTAISLRIRPEAGPSVNLVRRAGEHGAFWSIERWDYLADDGEFGQVDSAVVRLATGEYTKPDLDTTDSDLE
jgi:3',5'-cyclic AMP phosphodiesterase CpdA